MKNAIYTNLLYLYEHHLSKNSFAKPCWENWVKRDACKNSNVPPTYISMYCDVFGCTV